MSAMERGVEKLQSSRVLLQNSDSVSPLLLDACLGPNSFCRLRHGWTICRGSSRWEKDVEMPAQGEADLLRWLAPTSTMREPGQSRYRQEIYAP